MNPSLYLVKGILLLDNDGNRLLGKYYDSTFPTIKEQRAFEKILFTKTHKANGEIIMIDGLTIVYRSIVDLHFYVIGSTSENEIILVSVLNCFYDTISLILKRGVEKKALIDYMDTCTLALDEICDSGIILEIDPMSVMQRVSVRESDVALGEQTLFDVLKMAKDQIKSNFK
ncbi:unnamed protein product [Brachionus calyciflorus]|uniref:Coatomer subunit zeta n=1 Tax=Brachionus calyciflorus TaxID=104777 RepID=A0A813N2R5_9BILA|nr:unnamed protein product [Brachionus calyciflorus]